MIRNSAQLFHVKSKLAVVVVSAALAVSSMVSPTSADPIVEDRLSRLAGTLGAVHYLRTLCRPAEGQLWRNKMLELLASGEMDQPTRNALIGSFNAGYSRQQAAHKTCTTAAANLGNTYARQGAQQARDLARRLGS